MEIPCIYPVRYRLTLTARATEGVRDRETCGAKDGRRGGVTQRINSDRTLGYKCTCKHVSCNTQQAGRPELAAVLVRRGRAAPGKLRL